MLIGLSTKQAILIIEFAKEAHENGKSIIDSAIEAARLRFRAVMMTNIAFILGFLPLVFAKGAGAGSNENYDEMTYEGYAAGGVAVVIEAMTDNKNRTAGDIRSYFTKFNGNLGETGCVSFMFDKKG